MWKKQKVFAVLPTYNEKDSIRSFIDELFGSGVVDEVIVVNNNAAVGTDEEVRKTRALLVHEGKQGYGHAIQRGFEEALNKGADLVVLSEPDGTFCGHDCLKLLTYSDDFPVVFGTRTSEIMIWEGSNMGWFLKWGNFAVAKMTEVLFNTAELSDVGCTMRLFHRKVLEALKDRFTVGGSHFGPEMLLLVITHKIPFIEIPLNYRQRVGVSSVTGDKKKAIVLGLTMIRMILLRRLKTWFRRPEPIHIDVDNTRASCRDSMAASA